MPITEIRRVNFEAPADLVERFREVATDSSRSLSGELRELMKQRIAEHDDREPVHSGEAA